MTEREDIDALAAEYVLGTLDAAERASVAARRQREPELEAAIAQWERHFGPLAVLGPSVAPPPDLFARIEARTANLNNAVAIGANTATIVSLEQRVRRWRRVAGTMAAAAASLVIAVGLREFTRPPTEAKQFVAVFQQGDVKPAFVMTLDLERRVLSVRPVAASAPSGKTYQLWIVSAETGGVPRSLGLVAKGTPTTQATLRAFDPANIKQATFGVSLEPEGGSPTGRPTGPALHSKLFASDL
ncbi:MAG: anti-sigma factor [Hyphomicrobiaceae bacterium]